MSTAAMFLGMLVTLAMVTVVGVHIKGVKRLTERLSSDMPPPPNTGLLQGQVGYFGSAFSSIGSCERGLYACDSIQFPRGVLLPWRSLGASHRIGPITWFWLREYRLPLIVRTSLVRPYAEVPWSRDDPL